MPKLLRQDVGGTDYSMVGCALTATCATPAATAAKVATLTDGDTLADGMSVTVSFTYDSGVASPMTLTVGGVTANICDSRGHNTNGNIWQAGDIVTFLYTHGKFLFLNYVTGEVIHKDITIQVESGVTINTMFSALAYQLNHTDFSFLLAHPRQTATGIYELSGYYWGQYTATHGRNDANDNNITITGVIDWGSHPKHFSAFYSTNTGWVFEIDGQEYVVEGSGITLTRDSTTGRKYYMTQYAATTIQVIYDTLNYYELIGRPMKGIFNWKMNMAHNYTYVTNATVNAGTGTLNAGQICFFADPRIDAPNETDSTWRVRWNDGVSAFAVNLWGEAAATAECTWCSLEILT
jgi:hypothetical protein